MMYEFIRTESGWRVYWGIDPRLLQVREERFLKIEEEELPVVVDEDARLTVMAV